MIRTLIVDDEPLAREGIQLLLGEEPDIHIVGECSNGAEALNIIREKEPALMFLDVQMPRMDGFALLAAIPPHRMPIVIFVTAYDKHALKAFEVSALDYLLKPIKPERFQAALQKARQLLESRDVGLLKERIQTLLGAGKQESAHATHLSVKTGEKTTFVKSRDVDYIESAANYIILHAGGQNHVVRETLTNMESRLSPKLFLRVNRSTMVNLERVIGVKPGQRGEYVVILKNGKEISLTRGVREIQRRLEYL